MRRRLKKNWQSPAAAFLLNRKISAMSASAVVNRPRRWSIGDGRIKDGNG